MYHFKSSIRKFQGNERGAVAIMFAAALFVIFGGLAAAVDLTYTATVSNDVRHVGKSICGRAASAMNRGMSQEKTVDLSTKLGTELIQKTSLYNKNAAFNVNIDGSSGKVSVAGRATVSTPFISLFGVKSMRPNDTIECSGPVPTPPAPTPPPPTPQNSNCGGAAAAATTLGPQWTAINNGPGSSTTGFSNQSSGSQNGNSSGQGNPNVNHNAGVNSNNSNGSSANSSGGYSGQNGSTQGAATTSNLGANSYSCSNASTPNSNGTSFSFASGSGPGATAGSSTYASATSNGGGSTGGGAGGGPNGGGGGGGGSFCVGAGC